ncbi:MAG TPA: class II aldolase/adducin family protein [Synergistaceae bacterium]|jgi:L-fuculose-phosphate aldolase|nr:class II aldolase/adducin family protein [Synergistaceae bacterium]NLL41125.1 class II aldolase/adducin family protein [Synergistaceae bacterium]HPX03597.1 class II aldolase/adducin family protein [Synergistaceae bacterium]HQA54758.1 class II aldolase/adducin family protein [Synergistaceae bacterium]
MANEADIRKEIIKTGILILEKGLVQGTGGNISRRTEKGILITPSGMDYRTLTCEDIVLLAPDGKVLEGTRVPSIERSLHLRIYRSRADINAVIHTHSVYATAIAAARQPLCPITDNQVAVFGGTVPVADYAPIGTEELAENTSRALADGAGVLLSNHGALCVGRELSEALMRCEMLEVFSKIYILAKTVGGGAALTDEQVRCETEDLRKRYGQCR